MLTSFFFFFVDLFENGLNHFVYLMLILERICMPIYSIILKKFFDIKKNNINVKNIFFNEFSLFFVVIR